MTLKRRPAFVSVFSENSRRPAASLSPLTCRSHPLDGWRSMAMSFVGCRSFGITDRVSAVEDQAVAAVERSEGTFQPAGLPAIGRCVNIALTFPFHRPKIDNE